MSTASSSSSSSYHEGISTIYFTRDSWKALLKSLQISGEHYFILHGIWKPGGSTSPAFDTDETTKLNREYCAIRLSNENKKKGNYFRIFQESCDIRTIPSSEYSNTLIGKELKLRLNNLQRRKILKKTGYLLNQSMHI